VGKADKNHQHGSAGHLNINLNYFVLALSVFIHLFVTKVLPLILATGFSSSIDRLKIIDFLKSGCYNIFTLLV